MENLHKSNNAHAIKVLNKQQKKQTSENRKIFVITFIIMKLTNTH